MTELFTKAKCEHCDSIYDLSKHPIRCERCNDQFDYFRLHHSEPSITKYTKRLCDMCQYIRIKECMCPYCKNDLATIDKKAIETMEGMIKRNFRGYSPKWVEVSKK